MRTLIIALALSTTALASPAMAQDRGPYVGVEGGILILQDPKFDYSDPVNDINNAYELDVKRGLDVDLIAGYDLGMFRIEGELGWKRARVDEINVAQAISFSPVGNPYDGEGNSSAISAMLNGLVDIGDDRFTGYLGGGLGLARVRTNFRVPDLARNFSGSDSGLAWQVIAGVRVGVTDNLDLGLKYRHFRVPELRYRADDDNLAGPFRLDGKWKSNSFLASLIYNFTAPPPPPLVVAPPPPPPAAPATQVCPDGSVILATEMCPAPPPPPPPPPPAPERG